MSSLQCVIIMQQSANPDMDWTVGRLLSWTTDYFKSKGVDDATLCAQLLLAKVLGCSKVDLYLRFDQPVAKPQRDEFKDLIKRATEGEPIAYLIGHKEFFSLDFLVNRSVLVPRPETEVLVQWVIRKVRSEMAGQSGPLEILDLGTGSGCIAIALNKFSPIPAKITAVDKSAEAVELAKANAERNRGKETINFLVGDLFDPVADRERSFSFIVSNPPYVTEEDYARLPRHIKDYEPAQALVAGADGLQVIREIVAQAPKFLKSDGYLAMEIGYNQKDSVAELLAKQGYTEVMFERDSNEIPRVAIGRCRSE